MIRYYSLSYSSRPDVYRGGIGYLVRVSGRVRLTEADERAAVAALKHRIWRGAEIDGEVGSIDDLVWTARVARDGEWLCFSPDDDGDPKWSESASVFYGWLGRWAREGRIDVEGEDGEGWSYLYAEGQVSQVGMNGWDSSTTPTQFDPGSLQTPNAEVRTSGRQEDLAKTFHLRSDVAEAFEEFGRESAEFRAALEASDIAEARSMRRVDGGGARLALLFPQWPDMTFVDNRVAVSESDGRRVDWPVEADSSGLRFVAIDRASVGLVVERLGDGLRRGVGSLFWQSVELRDEVLARLGETVAVVVAMTTEDAFSDAQRQRLEQLAFRSGAILHENRRWTWFTTDRVRCSLL
jgi:hypothetical protein